MNQHAKLYIKELNARKERILEVLKKTDNYEDAKASIETLSRIFACIDLIRKLEII